MFSVTYTLASKYLGRVNMCETIIKLFLYRLWCGHNCTSNDRINGNSSNDRRPTCYGNQQNRQIQGEENGVALAAVQPFPEVEP
jgi:hypothetical protein